MPLLVPGQHIHLVGIGGVGLSAIARILLGRGYRVSGTDKTQNALADALKRDGADVQYGHNAKYVNGADALIISSAVPPDHVEVAAARERQIPIYKRSDIIGEITAGYYVIAVAGTHGKTTTTAMITHILRETGQDPSYIIGGILRSTGTNAGVGKGNAFVIEADEYDNMFHGLRPDVAIVTNVEWDHPDFFPTPDDMMRSFQHFVSRISTNGLLVTCADDAGARMLASSGVPDDVYNATYGISNTSASWQAATIDVGRDGKTTFDLFVDGDYTATPTLVVTGTHNVLNALAAMLAASVQRVLPSDSSAALATFEGTGRRFDVRGEVGGVIVIDDYAHHPTAIRATIEAAKSRYPDHALWAVWQPHTYSRTQTLMNDYLRAFEQADHVLVTDIYAAREQPVPGVSSAVFVEQLQHPHARHAATLDDAADILVSDVQAPAVILIMSAGDAPAIGIEFLRRRERA